MTAAITKASPVTCQPSVNRAARLMVRNRTSPPGDAEAPYSPSFEVVLAAAQEASPAAFEQLYAKTNRRLFAFVRLRGATDPEGMVNEVLFQAFQALDKFDGVEPQFNAWIFRIATNKLIDESRRRSRRPIEVNNGGSIVDLVASTDVEAEAIGGVEQDHLLAKLDCLTTDQREIVLLRVVSDLTISAIAEIVGKREGAVKALQRRAFRRLAKELNED